MPWKQRMRIRTIPIRRSLWPESAGDGPLSTGPRQDRDPGYIGGWLGTDATVGERSWLAAVVNLFETPLRERETGHIRALGEACAYSTLRHERPDLVMRVMS